MFGQFEVMVPRVTGAEDELHYGIVLENAAKRLGRNPLQTVP